MKKNNHSLMPNFLLIGAPRSGTTSLYEGLRQHPEIYVSPYKEPWFFALEGDEEPFRGPQDSQGVRELGVYSALFKGARGERAIGEASTIYLYSEKAPHRIKYHVPEAKLVVILRNPVDRAYSNYLQHAQEGREPLDSFAVALEAENERMALGWSPFWFYRRMGFYSEQLLRYFQVFDPSQVQVFLYEDLSTRPGEVFRSMYEFLGVDEAFVPDTSTKHNPSGRPKSVILHEFLTKSNVFKSALKTFIPSGLRRDLKGGLISNIVNRNLEEPPPYPLEVRSRLLEEYREDILKLQDLIHRDLSKWLQK